MTRIRIVVLVALGASLGVGSCGGSTVLGPVEPEEISIMLSVTGGLAGVDYSFTVDGGAGEVRGVRCVSFCDFTAGEVLLAISSGQVTELARQLDDAGVPGLGARDFGVGCCDLLHVELTYQRGRRTSQVRGTEDRLPEDLVTAIRYLHPLARRTLPIIVSPDTRDSDWPQDPYVLGRVLVEGSAIRADVTYSGGCEPHPMDLVAWGEWLESFPVQINALITHDDGDDPCDAVIAESRSFDLFPLARAYVEAYGEGGGEPPRVILRLWDPTPGGPRLIEVELPL